MGNGMRFESLADMPCGMRQKVVPHIVAGIRKEESAKPGPVTMDGIRFRNRRVAERYAVLMRAVEDGIIYDLHIAEEIPCGNRAHINAMTGKRVKAQVYTADFSYLVAAATYSDKYMMDDLEVWEAAAEWDKRLYEIVAKPGESVTLPQMAEAVRVVMV